MSKKLLLADDSITIQKVIGITFANEDYDLTVVDNGDAALEKARAIRPDLVLADVFMPGKNGYELCAAIRQDPALAGTPVLLLTGTFEPFDEGKARQVGANDWMAKPFESQGLIDRVEKLLATVVPSPVSAPAPAPPVAAVPPAPAPVAPPVALEEDGDMWGDFDAAEVATGEPVIEAPGEDFGADIEWASGFEPAAEEAPATEEDPWGGVSFGDEDLSTPAQTAPPQVDEDLWAAPSEGAASKGAAFEEETFVFEDEEDTFGFPAETPATTPAPAPSWDDEDDILALGEDDILEIEDLETDETAFVFEEEEDLLGTPAALGGAAVEESVSENKGFDEEFSFSDDDSDWRAPAPAAVKPVAQAAPPVAPARVAPAPVAPAPVVPAPVAPAPLAPAPAAVEQQVRQLSEEELSRIVEKVAGAVIERLAETILQQVAWEVVPDLAENLIKDELRKIKAEVGG